MAVRLLIIFTFSLFCQAETPAFPGAEGFGMFSKGGRGGKVYFVEHLNDSKENIKGSLRAALEAKGPRTVLFKVSGTVFLTRKLSISNPFLTVAGQTSPSGICIAGYGITVKTHDVTMRYLRIRPGDKAGFKMPRTGKYWETDGLCITGKSRNIIIDHCLISWANDEVCSVSGAETDAITVQWCFITESLNNSTHEKGAHGYGSLIRSSGKISYHHNLYAYHRSRSPRPGTYGDGVIHFDFRNNFMFKGGKGYSADDPVTMNFINNWHEDTPFIASENCKYFASGNKGKITGGTQLKEPLKIAAVSTVSAERARELILLSGGATLPERDSVDRRLVKQINSKSGELINSQEDVGGWPEFIKRKAAVDKDKDGIPDTWESKNGLNPQLHDSDLDRDGDGFTELEEFLNQIDLRNKDK